MFKTIEKKKIVFFIVPISYAVAAYSLLTKGINETGLRSGIQTAMQISTLLYLLILIAAPLYTFFNNNTFTRWLNNNQKYLTISYALTQILALFGIFSLFLYFSDIFWEISIPKQRSFGAFGLFFLLSLIIISSDRVAKWLGEKKWQLIQSIVLYYLYTIYMFAYLRRSFIESPRYSYSVIHTLLFCGLIVGLLLRLAWDLKRAKDSITAKKLPKE